MFDDLSERPKRGHFNTAFILAAVIITCFGSGIYVSYSHSPTRAVYAIGAAFEDHDWERFQEYVDVDSVLDNAVDVASTLASNFPSTPSNEWESLGRNLATGMLALIKPSVVASLKTQLRSSVESGDIGQLNKASQGAFLSGLLPSLTKGPALQVRDLGREGKISFVRVTLRTEDASLKDLHLDLKLRRRGWSWQVIGVTNLKEYFDRVLRNAQ